MVTDGVSYLWGIHHSSPQFTPFSEGLLHIVTIKCLYPNGINRILYCKLNNNKGVL